SRRWPRTGVGEQLEQGLPLPGRPVVRQDQAGRVHDRSCGQGCRQQAGLRQELFLIATPARRRHGAINCYAPEHPLRRACMRAIARGIGINEESGMLTRRGLLWAGAGGWLAARTYAADSPGAVTSGTEEVVAALPGKRPLIQHAFRPPNFETPLADLAAPFTP